MHFGWLTRRTGPAQGQGVRFTPGGSKERRRPAQGLADAMRRTARLGGRLGVIPSRARRPGNAYSTSFFCMFRQILQAGERSSSTLEIIREPCALLRFVASDNDTGAPVVGHTQCRAIGQELGRK